MKFRSFLLSGLVGLFLTLNSNLEASCFKNLAHYLRHLKTGFTNVPVETRLADENLQSWILPILKNAGWIEGDLSRAADWSKAESQLSRMRRSSRIIALLELPISSTGQGPKRVPGFRVGARSATNLEVFQKYLNQLNSKYGRRLLQLEQEFNVSTAEIFSIYLKYSRMPLGLIIDNIESHAKLFQDYGLSLKNSALMAVALGHVPNQDLVEWVPYVTKVFNSKIAHGGGVEDSPYEMFTKAEFVVSYATRFGSIPLSEIAEVAESVHLAAHSVQRGALSFLEVISRLDTRLQEALFRMGEPSVNAQFERFVPEYEYNLISLNPWKAFKERIAWSFNSRKIINEESIRKIRNVFLIDQIYTLICETAVRGMSIVTDDYQRYKFITNLVTFGLNDFVLGWTGVETASNAMSKSIAWKNAKAQFLRNRYDELKTSTNFIKKWAAFRELKIDEFKRYSADYPFPSRFSESNGTFYENLGLMKQTFETDPVGFFKMFPDYLNREISRQARYLPYYFYKSADWGLEFASQGKLIFKSGFLTTGVGISGLQFLSATFQPDENIEVEDRFITVLWSSFMVATWMATSSNLRYALVLRNLQNYWEKKFPTKLRGMDLDLIKQNQSKQIVRTRIAGGTNALVGGLGFIVVWQNPLDSWFEEKGGARDQIEELWDEFEAWLLKEVEPF